MMYCYMLPLLLCVVCYIIASFMVGTQVSDSLQHHLHSQVGAVTQIASALTPIYKSKVLKVIVFGNWLLAAYILEYSLIILVMLLCCHQHIFG